MHLEKVDLIDTKIIRQWNEAAKKGNTQVQYNLAEAYYQGKAISRNK